MHTDPPEVLRRTEITRRRLLQMTAGTGAGILLSKLGVIGEAIAASEGKRNCHCLYFGRTTLGTS